MLNKYIIFKQATNTELSTLYKILNAITSKDLPFMKSPYDENYRKLIYYIISTPKNKHKLKNPNFTQIIDKITNTTTTNNSTLIINEIYDVEKNAFRVKIDTTDSFFNIDPDWGRALKITTTGETNKLNIIYVENKPYLRIGAGEPDFNIV